MDTGELCLREPTGGFTGKWQMLLTFGVQMRTKFLKALNIKLRSFVLS